MASMTITIPDAQLARVLDGITGFHGGYSAVLDNGSPNPETQAQTAKRRVMEVMKLWVLGYEVRQSQATINASVATNITLS